MAEAERYNEKELTQIFKAFDESMNDFKRMIGEIYQSYSKQTGLDRQALEAIVNSTDLDHLVKQIQKKTGVDISEAIMRNYKGRINRLQALQEQAKAMVDKLARETQNKATRALKTTVEEGYKRTLYDIGKGVGINPAPFATLDERTIKTMLKTKWVGKENYSQRIWTNMDQMTKKLQSAMLRGAVTGMSEAKLINEFKKEFDIQRYKAERLIRTEMAYFNNQAELAAYDDLDVDEYMYIATLDSRTSEICRDLDGKHFPTKDGEPGKNMPPMHPNCRSTIAPYLGPELTQNLQRRARQEGNGENEVIKYQTYREWEQGNALVKHKERISGYYDHQDADMRGTSQEDRRAIKKATIPEQIRDIFNKDGNEIIEKSFMRLNFNEQKEAAYAMVYARDKYGVDLSKLKIGTSDIKDRGQYRPDRKTITLNEGLEIGEGFPTMAHELFHVLEDQLGIDTEELIHQAEKNTGWSIDKLIKAEEEIAGERYDISSELYAHSMENYAVKSWNKNIHKFIIEVEKLTQEAMKNGS